MFFGIAVVSVALIKSFDRNLERKNFKIISLLLKIGALLGLIAFLLASIKF